MRRAALWLAVALIAVACGSTSHKDRVADAGPTASGGAVQTGSGTITSAATAGPGGTTGGSSAVVGQAGTKPAPVIPGGGPVHLGTGVTSTTIKIGFYHSAPLGPAFQAVGFAEDPKVADERRIIDILVKWTNAHGGLGGRKIVPVYKQYDAVGGGTWDSLAAEACQTFVSDNHVFAVISGSVGQTDSLAACLAKGKTPLIQQNYWPYDGKYFSDYAKYLYTPGRMRPERWVPPYIDGLVKAGYFDKGFKLGLARFDAPVFARIAAMMKSNLARYGIAFTDEEVLSTPQSVSDFGQMSSEFQNAIVHFQSKGVNHVMFDEYAGEMPFFGLTIAENQKYRPRWTFDTTSRPDLQQIQHPDVQLKNSVVVGWIPADDVDPPRDPRKGGAHELCRQIIAAGGMTPARVWDETFCDSFFFLRLALSKTNNVTPDGLAAAAGGLGRGYDSPLTWSTTFTPGRPDGADAVRTAKYQLGCPKDEQSNGCYVYSSPVTPAG